MRDCLSEIRLITYPYGLVVHYAETTMRKMNKSTIHREGVRFAPFYEVARKGSGFKVRVLGFEVGFPWILTDSSGVSRKLPCEATVQPPSRLHGAFRVTVATPL